MWTERRGVRQGCPMPPLLFNIYIDKLVIGAGGCDKGWRKMDKGIEICK